MGDWIIPAVVIGGVTALVASVIIREKRRKAALEGELGARGVTLLLKPDMGARADALSRTGPYASLRTGAKGVRLCGTGEVEGVPVTYVEHSYTTGSGKSQQTHVHSILATTCPASWPTTRVRESHLGDTISGWLGKKDLQVEDAAFNKRWHISGDDADFALLLLTPEVQGTLNGWKRGRELAVGGGVMTVCARSRWNAANAVAALTDLTALRAELVRNLGEV